MKTQLLKPAMLALAGAVAFAAAGSASADPVSNTNYLVCNYKGQTTLEAQDATTQCWLSLAMKVDCDTGHFHVVAAGTSPGDAPACNALYLGNFPWGGDIADVNAGGATIETQHSGPFPYSVINGATFTPVAGGDVTGVSGSGTTNYACDGNTIPTPNFVEIAGTNNFGPMMGTYATLNTVEPHLRRQSCTEVSL